MCLQDNLFIPLALTIYLDHICLHDDDLYISLALVTCLDHICLHDDDLYIPLALAICLDCVSVMICIYPWPWQYVLTSGIPRNFVWGGDQQIQLKTEDRGNGDLGAVAP
jgi:hypothetical protein